MKKILILGGSGMLGSMLTAVLGGRWKDRVTATARSKEMAAEYAARLPGARWVVFDAGRDDPGTLVAEAGEPAWILNAIGITKPLVRDDNPEQVARTVRINAMLPHRVAEAARDSGARVLQIATDCVYSGMRGAYTEKDAHDALDVYGKTKSLGECYHENTHHLRCSIVGPEPKDYKFLLEWFLGQPAGGKVNGFTNHRWNGLGTLQFARLCAGVIEQEIILPHLVHIVPSGDITKADLLREMARCWGREDISITDTEAGVVVDRRLATFAPELNGQLWQAAGYTVAPTVPEMLAELAAYGRPAGARAAKG